MQENVPSLSIRGRQYGIGQPGKENLLTFEWSLATYKVLSPAINSSDLDREVRCIHYVLPLVMSKWPG